MKVFSVVSYDNGWWVDSNNNRWDARHYNKTMARIASDTLVNCYNCTNSKQCVDSTYLVSCVNCIDCHDCVFCMECEKCGGSSHCKGLFCADHFKKVSAY